MKYFLIAVVAALVLTSCDTYTAKCRLLDDPSKTVVVDNIPNKLYCIGDTIVADYKGINGWYYSNTTTPHSGYGYTADSVWYSYTQKYVVIDRSKESGHRCINGYTSK